MRLNDFHKQISHKIYERGEEYYEYGSVDNVEHDYPDTWTAEVEGSDVYSVEIKLNGDEIVSWDCDCPYDYGDMCKHVVAVLLYIRDNRSKHPVTIEVPLSTAQEQLSEILKQTNNKQLASFLLQYTDKNPEFNQALISNLHPKKKADIRVDYGKEIRKCFKHSYNSCGFENEGQAIACKLDSYIKKAKSLIKLNCQEEAMTILLHIIREIGDSYEEYDDYDGDLGGACQEAADLIAEMIKTDLSDDLLKNLTDEIGELIKNSNYDNYDLANLDELLLSISLKTSNFDNTIRIIDEALKNEPDTFRTPSLVMSKIELLENAGKKEEVGKVISSYLYLPRIREIRLEKLITEEQYKEALALIDEGISISEKKGHLGTSGDWKDKKMSVYLLMDNKEKATELAEDLFVNGRDCMKYYHTLKAVVPTEKWINYLDNLLRKSEKRQQWGLGHVYAQIYIEEEYWDRLMDYIEKNIQLGKYNSLAEYESYVKTRYPERMLAFYRTQIIDYAAKNMGRDHYKYVSDVLKKMKTYPNGTEIVDTLLAHFKSIYSKRRAMMEELGK
ncbi:SWIM zinc finger family protein [Bacteroides sp. UBA939]|uniref:SWIM zinc finger family protein n=1 Tax=Bacteroides sp. UBA939 TaxID=1946092 RepID=UPI0025C131C9|nr:SWIM zinc finger family protein [Bacteroides sp. UBA939]